jgi:hypothetical protein
VIPSNLRHASRILTRHPGFFALASLTLGLGIAANLALFSLLDAVYFRPLPLREPDRLVRMESTSPKAFLGLISYVESQEIAESVPAFEDVVVVGGRGVTLHRGGESHVLLVDYVGSRLSRLAPRSCNLHALRMTRRARDGSS